MCVCVCICLSVGVWAHSRVTEAKRKWCQPCPDIYDTLVSNCALITADIPPLAVGAFFGGAMVTLPGPHCAHYTRRPLPLIFFSLSTKPSLGLDPNCHGYRTRRRMPPPPQPKQLQWQAHLSTSASLLWSSHLIWGEFVIIIANVYIIS